MKITKSIVIGIFAGILVEAALLIMFGLNKVIQFSYLIFIISTFLTLLVLLIFSLLSQKIAWAIEPENNPDILNLKLNVSLAFALAFLGIGISLVISSSLAAFSSDLNQGIILMGGLCFIFIGQVISITQSLPRFRKLMIIYNEDVKEANRKK